MNSASGSYCDHSLWASKNVPMSLSGNAANSPAVVLYAVGCHCQWAFTGPTATHFAGCQVSHDCMHSTSAHSRLPSVTWRLLTCIHTTSFCHFYNTVSVAMMWAWSGHASPPSLRRALSRDFQLVDNPQQEGLIDSSLVLFGWILECQYVIVPYCSRLLSNSLSVLQWLW